MEKPLKPFGIRADEEKVETARKLGININDVFRKALEKAILEQSGKCPTCGKKSNVDPSL